LRHAAYAYPLAHVMELPGQGFFTPRAPKGGLKVRSES
jgi:hypothetical protein